MRRNSCLVSGFQGWPPQSGMTSETVWMERIRSRSSHFKSFGELSKFGRTALLERRYGLDSEEKSALRTCIDHLSEAIPVRDAVSMAERLEAIARKTTSESGGLNFNADPVHGCFYLSTEMFYIEINIDSAGIVTEAKVHHIDPSKETHKPPITIVSLINEGLNYFHIARIMFSTGSKTENKVIVITIKLSCAVFKTNELMVLFYSRLYKMVV